MDQKTNMQFRYFSSVEGQIVQRYGTRQFIGVTRTKDGWDWDTDAIVAIPEKDCRKFEREYQRAVRQGALKKRTKEEHDAHLRELDDTTNISTGDAAKARSSRSKSIQDESKGDVG